MGGSSRPMGWACRLDAKFSDADVAPVSSEDERGGASAPVVGFSELMWPQ